MKNFLLKVNDLYYAGVKEYDNDPARIVLTDKKENAKVCEGLVNMKSHWERIYNAMKNDTGVEVKKIEIEVI